jgi:glutamate dehydrogenase
MPVAEQRVVEQLSRRLEAKQEHPTLKHFASLLFGKADPALVEALGTEGLLAIAKRGLKFTEQRETDEVLLRVYNPSYPVDGWEAPYTVIEFCLGDRPFIVDSVKAELKRKNVELLYLLHPILSVQRDSEGKLEKFSDDGQREAFEMYFVEKQPNETLKALKTALKDVLEDVVLSTRDYQVMRDKAEDIAQYLQNLSERNTTSEHSEELREYAAFMKWLQDDNYVFLGYREYDILEKNNVPHLQVNAASGLGILTKMSESAYQESVPVSDIPEGLRERVTGGRTLVVTKTNAESTVHRPARMDYIGVKKLNDTWQVIGEQRFVGLFTSKGLSTPVADIPILRLKLRRVFELDRAVPGSHDYKQITTIFNSMPREELFWRGAEELHDDIRAIMNLSEEQGVRLTVRPDPLGRGLAAMVIMPRERFNAEVRRNIQDYLENKLEATHVDYQLAMGEDESQLRFHFFFTTQKHILSVDVHELERDVADLTRTWEDELYSKLVQSKGDSEAKKLFEAYSDSFSGGYKADATATTALRDIEQFEKLLAAPYCVDVLNVLDSDTTQVKIYHHNRGLVLSEVMPVLENLGLRVIEQISYPLEDKTPDAKARGLDIFRVQDQSGQPLDVLEHGERLQKALTSLLLNEEENDRLNKLVLYGSLTLRQVSLLRAYLFYYAQLNAVTSPRFVADTLLNHPKIANLLFEAFYAKFDPTSDKREENSATYQTQVLEALNKVSSLAEDTVIRGLLNLIDSSIRTNFFLNKETISFKLESRKVSHMPEPRPLYEIAVSGLGVSGTHLRGGKVARGGLRWSDRPDDFRTEVLGLMKTQMTKNAVIVPVGSKGGFVLKRAPHDREALRTYVQVQYKNFIRGLLDITDNLVNGKVVHPENVVVYDEADPYLVVAADKGTATFSDLANETAAEYNFWLGDAFASGGSYGYDHKKEGITARGAWECVSRHFREMGVNVKESLFTCVGIGDMSGDVFGNGMLYTNKLKLQGAFNHQHIFLDPTPDTEKSFAERQRMFVLPRSSWADYNKTVISEGGGVFERSAKSITLSPQVKTMLSVTQDSLSGQELVQALLKMPVDLLWNGGIGTYVKASTETNAEVGDSSNDLVRVSASELRAKVVGEGGNLGFTQLARIEYARAGGRINTDAIDNSAGVDMSDHEVNIKILLQPLMASGELSFVQRNRLLKEMTNEVNTLVLKDNYSQSLCLSLAEKRSRDDISIFDAQMDYLSEHGGLNTNVEFLPNKKVLLERQKANEGLTRPELAILLAYTKMGIYRWLLDSKLPDEPYFQHYLDDYFPEILSQRYPEAIRSHALRREIIATQFTNTVVDLLGITFVQRLVRDTGAAPGEIIRAALIAFELLDVQRLQKDIFALDNKVAASTQYAVLHELVKTVEGCVAWLLTQNVTSVEDIVKHYHEGLTNLRESLGKVLSPTEKKNFDNNKKTYLKQQLPKDLASQLAGLEYLPSSLGVIAVSQRMASSLNTTAKVFFEIGEALSLGYVRDGLAAQKSNNKWEKIALNSLVLELRDVQASLTQRYLEASQQDKALSVEAFLESKAKQRFEQTLADIRESNALSLASGQVLAKLLEQLYKSGR